MRAFFLILVLAISAQTHSFGEEQPVEIPPPHELLEQARQAAKRATQSHEHQSYLDAVELYSRFISHYPTHDEASSALNRLGTLYRATYKNREALMRALHKLVEQGERSTQYKTAMEWIKGNEEVLEWRFGNVPTQVQPTKDKGIRIALGNVFWRRAYLPTYRLYRIPPKELEPRTEKSNVTFSGTHMVEAEDVPRDRWESVSFRAEMFKPNPEDHRRTFYARSGRQAELFDTLHVDLSAGGLFVLEQELEGFRDRIVLHVPKFGLFCKSVGNETFVYAADPWTGQPIKNLKVDLRVDDKLSISRSTNDDGFVSLPHGKISSHAHAFVSSRLESDIQNGSLYLSTSSTSSSIAFITTDRPIYRPNQTVQFKAVLRDRVKGALKPTERKNVRVEIRGPEGRLLQSQEYPVNEFGSLSGSFRLTDEPALGEYGIVDQSLFDLAEDNSLDIRSFFFPSPALQGMSSYGQVTVPNDERYVEDRFADLAFGGSGFSGGGFGGGGFGGGLGGGGGGFFGGGPQRPFVTSVIPVIDGGGEVGGFGAAMPAETEVRSKLADTFYWSAHVQVGKDGKAELDLEVPDTLGQWRIVARAISGSDRFGIATSSVVSRKDAIVRLSTPRFFTQGDRATVSTVVNNNLDKEATFSIQLECEGALAGGQQSRTIAAVGQARIDWPIKVERSGTVTLRAKALSETASDAMELKLPVRPYGIERRIARNGRLEKGTWNTALVVPEDADLNSAKLEIVVSSASTAAIRDALPYLADYPYGCVEQTMSRFLPAVVASGAMKRQGIENKGLAEALPHMVEQGLARLYGFQHEDGGWGWWKHDKTDDFMTTYVVFGLLTAQQAGYEISEQILQEGVEAVQSNGLTPFSTYVLRMAKADIDFDLDDIGGLKDPAADPRPDGGADPFGDAPNPFGDASGQFRQGEFFVALPAKTGRFATEDLAYLVLAGFKELAEQLPPDPPKHSDPDLVRTTALVVRALASVDPKDKRIPPLVDWLMQQRRGGAWYSTLDTAYAVFALSALAEPGDNPPVQVTVNGMRTESMSGRVVLTGKDIRRGENKIEIHQPEGKRIAYASVLLNYFATDLDKAAEKDALLAIRRKFERAVIVDGEKQWRTIESGGKVTIDDELRVTTIVNQSDQVERLMIESPLPAGTEPRVDDAADDVFWDYWFGRRELRDDRVSIAASHLYGDDNQFEFRLRPTLPGRYHVLPARVFPMYNPDQQAHSPPFVIEVIDSK